MSSTSEGQPSISQILAEGKKNLAARGSDYVYPGGKIGPSVRANRQYLDSLFFETRLLDNVEVEIAYTLFGVKFATPIFCAAISRLLHWPQNAIADIATAMVRVGSFIVLGIGNSTDLQSAIDTGARVVKMVKPYRNTDLIFEKVRDAEERGCMAVGMDIDHFYGALSGDTVVRTQTFAPKRVEEIQELIAETRLPFIVKGVLSISDADKVAAIGASAIEVSNHGSSSFDFAVPSMFALPAIADRLEGRIPLLVDSGFETGSDIFKGIGFGAVAVGMAHPIVLAYEAGGAQAVELLINQITAELKRNMAAAGCASLSSITKSIFRQIPCQPRDPDY